MNRYYLPAGTWNDNTLKLTGDEAKHCSRVMRAKAGDKIEIFDGTGTSAICRILSVTRDLVTCSIEDVSKHNRPTHSITLCQAIPKGGNMELIVQKSVELGVAVIQPLITAHTVARPDSLAKKQAKWQRIVLEACKQCGQNYLPEILEPQEYHRWIQQLPDQQSRIVAALDPKAVHLKTLIQRTPLHGNIALLIGPEGDFSAEEYQQAFDANFQPVSFGPIIMRVETATLYGLSILQHELSSLDH